MQSDLKINSFFFYFQKLKDVLKIWRFYEPGPGLDPDPDPHHWDRVLFLGSNFVESEKELKDISSNIRC